MRNSEGRILIVKVPQEVPVEGDNLWIILGSCFVTERPGQEPAAASSPFPERSVLSPFPLSLFFHASILFSGRTFSGPEAHPSDSKYSVFTW